MSPRFRFRVTLLGRDNTPVVGGVLRHRLPGRETWSESSTDDGGQALLGPQEGLTLSGLAFGERLTTPVQVGLPAGRYAFVVEAVDVSSEGDPVVVGVGTTVLTVSQ